MTLLKGVKIKPFKHIKGLLGMVGIDCLYLNIYNEFLEEEFKKYNLENED